MNIYKETESDYLVFHRGRVIGRVELYDNSFHGRNQYLRLHLSEYDVMQAQPLFSQLQDAAKRPLQVMLSSEDAEQAAFLLAGGFVCRRKCYEMEVCERDLLVHPRLAPLETAKRGQPEYAVCCRLLYDHYKTAHAAVSPLTADFAAFCGRLPSEALYGTRDGEIWHVAFVEENEIAYLGSKKTDDICIFAEAIIARLFARHETICFECDDCDAAAMALKNLFCVETEESYDTYVRE